MIINFSAFNFAISRSRNVLQFTMASVLVTLRRWTSELQLTEVPIKNIYIYETKIKSFDYSCRLAQGSATYLFLLLNSFQHVFKGKYASTSTMMQYIYAVFHFLTLLTPSQEKLGVSGSSQHLAELSKTHMIVILLSFHLNGNNVQSIFQLNGSLSALMGQEPILLYHLCLIFPFSPTDYVV